MELIKPRSKETLMEMGVRCNAVYICPKDGPKRKGPLVVYAGIAQDDPQKRNFVGDMYFNFARIEEHPLVVEEYALAVYVDLMRQELLRTFDTICGVPEGGRTFGQALARLCDKRFVYPTKKAKPTEPGKKQLYEWDLSRFEFEKGERVAVVEDVINNFTNTDNTLTTIGATGAEVVLLLGAFNRSPHFREIYTPKGGHFAGKALPIVASISEPYPEYRQDDPEVAADIAAGRLELEVKKNWPRLRAIMQG